MKTGEQQQHLFWATETLLIISGVRWIQQVETGNRKSFTCWKTEV